MKLYMKPPRSSGLLSLNDFYLNFWNHGMCETPRCQYISVQRIDFFMWKSLFHVSFKASCTITSVMPSSSSINCSSKMVLLFPSSHLHSVAKPVSPRTLGVPWEEGPSSHLSISPELITELGSCEQSKISQRIIEKNCSRCHQVSY